MTEHRDSEHFLRVHHDEGDYAIEVFHPESCTQEHVIEEQVYSQYNCAIASHIRHWGYDLHLAEVPDGMYLAQYWATPPGWAGPVPIDGDDGIELNPLQLLDWAELNPVKAINELL